MPTWLAAPSESLSNAFDEAMHALSDDISTGPSFEDVLGVHGREFLEHAMAAVSAWMEHYGDKFDVNDPQSWINVYSLGFVIGFKYKETLGNVDSDHPEASPPSDPDR